VAAVSAEACDGGACAFMEARAYWQKVHPSVVLGLDPRTHARLRDCGNGFKAQGLE